MRDGETFTLRQALDGLEARGVRPIEMSLMQFRAKPYVVWFSAADFAGLGRPDEAEVTRDSRGDINVALRWYINGVAYDTKKYSLPPDNGALPWLWMAHFANPVGARGALNYFHRRG